MILSPWQGFLTALSTAGAPSFSLWVLAFAFGLCGFGFATWTAATRAANKRWHANLPVRANGEDTSTAPNIPAVIAGMRQAKAKAIAGKALLGVLFFGLGAMWQSNRQLSKAVQGFDNTVQVLNAVVEQQNGLTIIYHYLDDPAEKQHSQIFCAEPANRVPHFKPRQIIASMNLIRQNDCEVVANLSLRRVNGAAILAGGY